MGWGSWVREAVWLTPQRAARYAAILAAVEVAGVATFLVFGGGGLDAGGKPLGTDFISFWAASSLALGGSPASVYSPQAHELAQAAIFPDAAIGYYGFFYPPVFLLVCLPLALLPYLASLVLWLTATGAFYASVIRRFLPARAGPAGLLCFAFPAILINLGHGQNGFLTAGLFGAGILLLGTRPVLAGFAFGCLAMKPHLAIMLPFALALRGEWKAFAATGLTAVGLALASLLVLGVDTWDAFVDMSPLVRAALDNEVVGAAKMVSVFAAVQVLGGAPVLAYGAQAAAVAVCVLVLARLARAGVAPLAFGAATAAATLLATPFLLDYDLTLLAIPLAYLFRQGVQRGFLPYEKVAILCGFVLPMVSRSLATLLGLPVAPLVLSLIFALLVRRALHESAEAAPSLQSGAPHQLAPAQ